MAEYKRRKYFIRKRHQAGFILRFVTSSALGGLVAVIIFNLVANRKLETVMFSMRLPNTSTSGLLMTEAIYTNVFAVIFIVLAFVLTARGLFKKINGPLRKLASEINRIGNGNLSAKVMLRYKDEFHDFADDVNSMVDELGGRLKRIKEQADKIKELSEEGAAMELSSLQSKIDSRVAELEEEVKALNT